jgi:hypothetical protein
MEWKNINLSYLTVNKGSIIFGAREGEAGKWYYGWNTISWDDISSMLR